MKPEGAGAARRAATALSIGERCREMSVVAEKRGWDLLAAAAEAVEEGAALLVSDDETATERAAASLRHAIGWTRNYYERAGEAAAGRHPDPAVAGCEELTFWSWHITHLAQDDGTYASYLSRESSRRLAVRYGEIFSSA